MRVIVAGCGKVGFSIAKSLAEENHDVVVIDIKDDVFGKVEQSIDVMRARGNALSAETLREAGIERADLLIAVMEIDEANILCCAIAKRLGVNRAIARVRAPEFAREMAALQSNLGVDMIVNPELEAAGEISRILRFRAASDVETFVDGRVELVSFEVTENDHFAHKPVSEIVNRAKFQILLAAILRGDDTIIPRGNVTILPGDVVSVIGRAADVTPFFRHLRKSTERTHDALIIGGGMIAYYLCEMLEKHNIHVKLIEMDPARCEEIASAFPHVTVIQGDGTDYDVLESESFENADAIACLAGHDEDNILIGLNAMQSGVEKVVVKLNHVQPDMVRKLGITSLVYPKNITAYQILRYVRAMSQARGGEMASFYRVVGSEGNVVEALEFRVQNFTDYTNKPLRALRLKPNTLVGCIVRGRDVVIPSGDVEIHIGDDVVILAKNATVTKLGDIFEA